MSLFPTEPDIFSKSLFLAVFSSRFHLNRKFLKLIDSSPEILNHDRSIKCCPIIFVGVRVVLDHIHQVASPMHQPLMCVE